MIFIIQRLYARFRHHAPLKMFVNSLLFLSVVFILHTMFFKSLENVSWEESLWQTWQTFTTVGYGNRPAETLGGRWTTIFFGTVGIAFLGVIISQAFDLKEDRRERRRLGMMENTQNDCIVIINYPGESALLGIVREIKHLDKKAAFCVVDEKIEQLPPVLSAFDHIHFVKGNLLKEETYKKAGVHKSKAVIVFPSEPGVPRSDGLTQTIVDQASKFAREDTSIVYIQVDQENDWLFENSPGTAVLESFEVLAVVQEINDKFSSVLVEKLLLNTTGANPKTVIPKSIVGWTWAEFNLIAVQTGLKIGVQINPFGLIKKGETFSCPDYDTVIENGDLLSLIAYNGFNWDKFEKKMLENK
ncbi:MAG: two pore domain potassium channel family protein [Nanoarchaeota archaeon]|nr:two pore domain potassium channel family protein [Nanoarchaeota archaeon]